MHEVAGEAAVYVDPTDPDAIARAIRSVLDDPLQRERMAREGLARAAGYSWERTAQSTRAAILTALAG